MNVVSRGTATRILVVEDDAVIRLSLRTACEREGYVVIEAGTGKEGLRLVAAEGPSLVLLDLLLPDINGLDVCRSIRQHNATIPIIILTARADEVDKVVGLEVGADDYVTKPFSPRELIARIRAVLRRSQLSMSDTNQDRKTPTIIKAGDIEIKLAEREVLVLGERVGLTPTEFDLLAYLARNTGIALTRGQILSHVWGYDVESDSRLLDSHIAHLRAKIEADPSRPEYVATVRNIGYKFAYAPSKS